MTASSVTDRPIVGAAYIAAQDQQAATIREKAAKKEKRPYAKIVLITPEIAKDWLERSAGNRKVALAEIKAGSRDITTGHFDLNGETLKFDWNNRFRDGHKRLRMVVESGDAIESFVIFDLDPRSQGTVDIGKSRTGAQALLDGEFAIARAYDNNVMNGIVAWMMDLHAGQPGGGRKEFEPSVRERLLYIQDNPLLIDAVQYAISARRQYNPISPSTWGVAWYLCTDGGKKRVTPERFFNSIQTGVGLTADHPALLIRDRMQASIQAKASRTRKGVLNRHQVLALVILGYNCHVNMLANQPQSNMTIPADLRNAFPVPMGYSAPWATTPTAGQLDLA